MQGQDEDARGVCVIRRECTYHYAQAILRYGDGDDAVVARRPKSGSGRPGDPATNHQKPLKCED